MANSADISKTTVTVLTYADPEEIISQKERLCHL